MPVSVRRGSIAVAFFVVCCLANGCAAFGAWTDSFEFAFKGITATMTTYNENGQKIDRVHGTSFRVTRDDRFDTSDSEGVSKKDSSVLLISLGNSHISHVGSSMVMAEDGIVNVSDQLPATVSFENSQRGMPWLNDLIEKNRNLWHGKGKNLNQETPRQIW